MLIQNKVEFRTKLTEKRDNKKMIEKIYPLNVYVLNNKVSKFVKKTVKGQERKVGK